MDIVWWLIVGFVAGAIARLLVPGRNPMGLLGTIVLGLAGSLIGGFLGDLVSGDDHGLSPASLFGSIVGAIILLLIFRAVARRGGVPGEAGRAQAHRAGLGRPFHPRLPPPVWGIRISAAHPPPSR
jgi:uncharacterized membrane protein YeaQ/YmgE (transglycosylase-associated protein family)